jgi:V8-like Glu-specific endopeptidase
VNLRILAATLTLTLATTVVVAGCSSTGTSAGTGTPAAAGPAYWTRHRLLGAGGFGRFHLPSPGSTPTPRQSDVYAPRIGALFDSDSSGDHFCTASVVTSAAGNVLITAAHCINSGTGGANRSNVVFIPNYANGNSPNGVWTPERYVIDPRWTNGADPDLDVAFIVLKPLNGTNIQNVLGANQIAFNAGFKHLVRVAGYPDSGSAPISCLNWTSQQSPTQLQFNCNDFTGGTSGSPWITKFDPQSRTGTIVGLIGGYQEGGDTAAISYSPYLDDNIEKLYNEANSS